MHLSIHLTVLFFNCFKVTISFKILQKENRLGLGENIKIRTSFPFLMESPESKI